jgi:predicted oxidoreductase
MPHSAAEQAKHKDNNLHFSDWVQGYWRANDWKLSANELLTFIKQHLELGVTTVDHASIYGNPSCESLFGESLKLAPELREKMQIVTKCGIQLNTNKDHRVSHYTSTAGDITKSVEQSLTRLNTDHIDALLIHRPDFLMDADEIASAFDQLKQQGKVLNFGVSNFSSSQFSLLESRLDFPLVTNQVEINPVNFEVIHDGTLDQLQQKRIRPMAWSCLAGGALFNGESEQIKRLRSTLNQVAEEHDHCNIESIIFAWIRALPSNPMLILGSGKIQRLESALESKSITLTREQWYRIWQASKGHPVP